MAIRRVCDRCRCSYSGYINEMKLSSISEGDYLKHPLTLEGMIRKKYDLCPGCTVQLKMFMRGYEVSDDRTCHQKGE